MNKEELEKIPTTWVGLFRSAGEPPWKLPVAIFADLGNLATGFAERVLSDWARTGFAWQAAGVLGQIMPPRLAWAKEVGGFGLGWTIFTLIEKIGAGREMEVSSGKKIPPWVLRTVVRLLLAGAAFLPHLAAVSNKEADAKTFLVLGVVGVSVLAGGFREKSAPPHLRSLGKSLRRVEQMPFELIKTGFDIPPVLVMRGGVQKAIKGLRLRSLR